MKNKSIFTLVLVAPFFIIGLFFSFFSSQKNSDKESLVGTVFETVHADVQGGGVGGGENGCCQGGVGCCAG